MAFGIVSLTEIFKIQNEGFENQNADILIGYSKKMKETFYVIKYLDEPVGYCIYYIKPIFSLRSFKKKAIIYSVAIDRNFRRKGFGEKLLRESIKEIKLNRISGSLICKRK